MSSKDQEILRLQAELARLQAEHLKVEELNRELKEKSKALEEMGKDLEAKNKKLEAANSTISNLEVEKEKLWVMLLRYTIKDEFQLQATRTRFSLIYSAVGRYWASQIHSYFRQRYNFFINLQFFFKSF